MNSKYANWDQVKLTDFAHSPIEISLETIFDLNALTLRKIFDGEVHLMILSDEDLKEVKKALEAQDRARKLDTRGKS